MQEKILFVDDDYTALECNKSLINKFYKQALVYTASNQEQCVNILKKEIPNVIVLDLSLNSNEGVESGFNLLDEIIKINSSVRVIVLTGHSSSEYGVRAIMNGAASFLSKPVDHQHLIALIKDGVKQSSLRKEFNKIKEDSKNEIYNYIIGCSSFNEELVNSLTYASKTDQPILITGETGTGKGYCAELIHKFSARRDNKFVKLQPIFSNADLVNSELFGHVKGSFTGALTERKGLFLEANKGTLFLDEIDSFSLETQVSLLGVLQNKKFRALGSNEEKESNFRLISATNQNIESALEEKKIRQDLYFRIANLRINLLPLRERIEDLPKLSYFFIDKINEHKEGKVDNINNNAFDKLLNHNWPGNIRELESVINTAVEKAHFSARNTINENDICIIGSNSNDKVLNFHSKVSSYKKHLVTSALTKNQNSQVKAAKSLGIDRGTLRRIIE